jgi:mannose-1-phosphate guanylyltransferase
LELEILKMTDAGVRKPMEKYAVILAGGAGLRLWPLSRESRPKQFIMLDGNKSMLLQTLERIIELIPAENCYVVTNQRHLELAKETLKNFIPDTNILLEPLLKNTAACICYSTLLLEKKVDNALLCFIPADSYIRDKEKYLAAIRQAFDAAESGTELVIIGVKPTYPATGYGYIQVNWEEAEPMLNGATKVVQFKEKPTLSVAKQYIESKNYLWNSGMVAGQMKVLVHEMRQHIPGHVQEMTQALKHQDETDYDSVIEAVYHKLEDISFDNGVLERTNHLLAIGGEFDWNDIGSLEALSVVFDKDANNNALQGKHFGIDTTNSVIYAADSMVTTIGLDQMIIIDTGDSIIVCPKERAQDVKILVQMMKENGFDKYT